MKNFLYITLLIILSFQVHFSQARSESLKRQALVHMQAGRYGEAIDQLHKYISANARNPEGYNLRGLCYEKRAEYQYAVLDFRRAVRLSPDDEEYRANLNRVMAIWHQLLYEKIEGHKREIAIDPTNPVNYLEIGKSYRWLEEWALAEQWYDEYLRRDEYASPDEIIRYTEILSHTGSIVKGEKILKKYVDRHPDDWRLWSRYGYFTMWLGHRDNARNAFQTALGFKPFFKEAQDGLDLANDEGYMTQFTPRSFEKVYPIDKFYKLIQKRPEDFETRYKLVDELIANQRFEEAFQQMEILSPTQSETERYQKINEFLTTIRDSLYESNIQEYSAKVKIDPKDKESVVRLADAYGKLYAFEDGIEILEEYLEDVPDNEELDLRFKLAQFAAWNYEWEKAIEQMNILMEIDPENIDYQLLRGQISVWTVLELDEAEGMLNNVLEARPGNLNAILALASLHSWQKEFDLAKKYVDLAKEINPNSPEVEEAESNYLLHLSAYDELKLFELRARANELAGENNCEEALEVYDEYLSKITGPNRDELKQYASINMCAEEYEDAISIYSDLIDEEYEYILDLERAKGYLWNHDTLTAVNELQRISEENPDEFYPKLFLGDAYHQMKEPGTAYDIYEDMLEETTDSNEIKLVQQRLSWLPPVGLHAGLIGFVNMITPMYVALSPQYTYFSDNQNLSFHSLGGRLDFGFSEYLTLGGSYQRTILSDESRTEYLSKLMGNSTITFSKQFSIDGGYGKFITVGEDKKDTYYITGRYNRDDNLKINLGFEHTDARLILFSPNLINNSVNVDAVRFSAEYIHRKIAKLVGRYNYYTLSDGVKGNDITLRLGKRFLEEGYFGYEYYFIDYSMPSNMYYSPQNIEAHSLWGDWELERKEHLKVTLGGKIGYYPAFDFILNEIYAESQYIPTNGLTLNGRISFGSSYRFDSSYNSFSIALSAYWNIF